MARQTGEGRRRAALIAPAVLMIGLFMLVPVGIMAAISFMERGSGGGVNWGSFTTEPYLQFLFERDLDDSLLLNTDYLQIFFRSIWLAVLTTALTLAVGLPTALFMALQPERRRNFLIFLVTIPFWTNLLVRNYAWILLLRNNGLIDQVLMGLGLRSEPIGVLYTTFSIAVGLTYTFMPFMVLPIYASLEKLDWRLIEAAYDLGADRWRALRRVVVPLAMPGIAAGCILVFIPCLGAFVTPELLGGGKALMIGNLIQSQFGAARNWPFGAALSMALLAAVLLAMMLYLWRYRRAPGAA
ncbi:MAG TPA: ABC transporter permease [Geminicoccus sp.]|uniref:ABC transporter permease n=1 Tax=Geminicoccus sp. TaxID=2024832 RepID=UPI002BD0A2F5|nr:ABC transporter permease [Geminicoccus sp.]HWL70444.1 ABC transporter permease [Geminicoccus sp.]